MKTVSVHCDPSVGHCVYTCLNILSVRGQCGEAATNNFINNMFTKQEVQVHGTVKKGYEAVKEVFENNFKNGEELSAQVCVYKKGEKVTR